MSDVETDSPSLPAVTDLPAQFRIFADGKVALQRQRGDGEFLPIEFPERAWRDGHYGLRYHVFTSKTERVSVPAVSAIDAIIQSGVERPLRIVRGMAAEETVAAVIKAGRLVPTDQNGDTAENAPNDESPDQPGIETGPADQAEASSADPQTGDDAAAAPDAGADVSEDAGAGEPEPE